MTKHCPFCNIPINISLVRHIKSEHGEDALRKAILADKRNGIPDVQIGNKYGISYRYLERVITQEYGTNISTISRTRSKITQWEPKRFQLETTTVWSFKNRGKWATHDGRYRGNWSPYIPRNLILRYSQPTELVLDYFSGGGTTAVEAHILSRRCIARDINPDAIALTKQNINFRMPQDLFSGNGRFPVRVELGDARDLACIEDDSIDLICAHPPYAGIISYSANTVHGDLSTLGVPQFLEEMKRVADESYRVLKPGRQCAILIGDSRQSKHVVPIGFLTIRAFLNAGFLLRELIIKRQHNCKTTGFWYSNSIRYNFLLLAHEFLPVFEKPARSTTIATDRPLRVPSESRTNQSAEEAEHPAKGEQLETTSVWIFPASQMQAEIRRNLLGRFAKAGGSILELEPDSDGGHCTNGTKYALAYIRPRSHYNLCCHKYLDLVDRAVRRATQLLAHDTFCVVELRDVRNDGVLVPLGLLAFERLTKSGLELREIVIVTSEENRPFEASPDGYLGIAHKYLLIYRKP